MSSSPGTPKNSVLSISPYGTPKSNFNQVYNEQFFYENQILSFQSCQQVSRVIDHLVTCGANILYDKYLLERSPFYEAEDLCRWTYNMLLQDHLSHDPGENQESIKNQLTQEMEPPNKKLDSRSCLSAKTEYKIIYPEVENDDQSETKSNYSRISSISKVSKISAIKKIKKIMTASQLLGQSMNSLSRSALPNIDNINVEDQEGQQQASQKKEEFQVVYVGDDVEYERKKKEEQDDPISEKLRDLREKKDKERQIEQARKQKMLQEELEVDERKKEQQRQLKNKEFTQDYDGNVIFLNKNRQENLPNDLAILESKGKQQSDIVKPVPLETQILSSPVKLVNEFIKKKKENLSAAMLQEFHKQPPLHEVLNPNEGVKVLFQTGHKKIGSEFKTKDNQMTKKQYDELVSEQPNRPVPKYIQNIRQAKVDINDKANQIIELSEHSSQKSSNKLKRNVKPQSAGMNIINKDALLMMLSDEPPVLKPTSSQLLPITASNRSIQSVKKVQKQEKNENKQTAVGVQIQDKIKFYNQKQNIRQSNVISPQMSQQELINEDLQELGLNIKNGQKRQQQNLNLVIEKFNKQILEDPNWGISKKEPDSIERQQYTPMKMPTYSRVQSAKAISRPESAISKYSSQLDFFNQQQRPFSGRPTTANTNSRLSQNKHSFFKQKLI
ncbi:hypothetical protein TTHERM_00630480 (macronuclear) [Tetrahymena thermophila SB210]|uniref:Uncharacterized protein n=1 Tax=Tetrahymena thermophila (strain SB210) TaxID=312017 RepID=Q241P3_TETTS|nr:hypothetical protein TTHERM_00630480 [Tetrahymena thermophila SB210]EAS02527.2 hypothetical protein TTHERM_00630480 [Tetrahymena thermophila SB210]|eukprot:XP_001022772.2 hypothetical protein TTHERM_00630480 [Tetrahymena thermophila SB210]